MPYTCTMALLLLLQEYGVHHERECFTLGNDSYANEFECPIRNQSSSAMWGAYGDSNITNGSIIFLGCLSHWNGKKQTTDKTINEQKLEIQTSLEKERKIIGGILHPIKQHWISGYN